jgi:signal transduction histidine kinase
MLEAGPNPQHRRDLQYTAADGTTVDLDLSVTPVQIGTSKNSDFIVVGRDITKERSLDRQREEFIEVASHELKTPLAIMEVALSTALIGKADFKPQAAELIEQAHRNTLYLSNLVRDLTTLSEAQNDSLPISLKPVDAAAVLRQLGIDFQPQAKAKGLPLQVVVKPNTPGVLSTEHYIREVLQNYLNNALKYTEKGHITLSAAPTGHGGVRFGVSDTGYGISAANQQHLFTKFFRAEDYRTRETGGTGLGLYLCLEIAGRLNAKVWCESKLGEGSTFYLEVPPFSQLKQDHGKVVEAQVSNLVDQL